MPPSNPPTTPVGSMGGRSLTLPQHTQLAYKIYVQRAAARWFRKPHKSHRSIAHLPLTASGDQGPGWPRTPASTCHPGSGGTHAVPARPLAGEICAPASPPFPASRQGRPHPPPPPHVNELEIEVAFSWLPFPIPGPGLHLRPRSNQERNQATRLENGCSRSAQCPPPIGLLGANKAPTPTALFFPDGLERDRWADRCSTLFFPCGIQHARPRP